MRRACTLVRTEAGSRVVATRSSTEQEAFIRVLSVSLLAVAAIAASLVLSRTQSTSSTGIPAGESAPAEPSLDKIREAGL